jgi:hypothetical protein
MLHIENIPLELLVEDAAVGDYNNAVEHYFVTSVVQVRQMMGKPSYSVRFA